MNQIVENVKVNAIVAQISAIMKVYFYFQNCHCLVLIAQLCNYQIENIKFHAVVTHISAIMKFLFDLQSFWNFYKVATAWC